MPFFNPNPDDLVVIGTQEYRVVPHPATSSIAYGQESRRGIVYCLKSISGQRYALKQFKAAFRSQHILTISKLLQPLQTWNGLQVASRLVITRDSMPELVTRYPDLEYAVLMPWVEGNTWFDSIYTKTPLATSTCMQMASSLTSLLSRLEAHSLAHTDISSGNVLFEHASGQSALVGLESFYGPGFPEPLQVPFGTDGYRHPKDNNGQWNSAGDRFAAAVLTSECLTWYDEEIRSSRYGEHFFDTHEIGKLCHRYNLMHAILQKLNSSLAGLFELAWFSGNLQETPTLKAWHDVVLATI